MKPYDLSIIVAVDNTGGYATRQGIPWSFKSDWKHFKSKTKNNICVMGRKTYQNIAEQRSKKTPNFRTVLQSRESYVLSRTRSEIQGATVCMSIPENLDRNKEIFLLGGFHVWMRYWNDVNQIWMTIVPGKYETTKKFPVHWLNEFEIVEGRKELVEEGDLLFVKYVRKDKVLSKSSS